MGLGRAPLDLAGTGDHDGIRANAVPHLVSEARHRGTHYSACTEAVVSQCGFVVVPSKRVVVL